MMIAIAIPCWNTLSFTRIGLESILRNSSPHHIELVLLDNGSTDGTRKYLRSLSPKVLIENKKNLGVTKAWNQLIEASLKLNPDVIALLNNDILACPGWLDPVVKECAKKDMRYFQGRSSISRPDGSTFRNMPLGNAQALAKAIREIEDDGRRVANEMRGKFSTGGQGWSYFFRPEVAKVFHPIPEQLHLWYNDNYIYKMLEEAGYAQTVLMDCCIVHWGSASVCNYSGFNKQVAKDKEEWIRLFGPISYAEYVTPGGLDWFITESKKTENAARIESGFGTPRPLHVLLSYIAEYRGGVCVGVTSDQTALAGITAGVNKRDNGFAFGIGSGEGLKKLDETFPKFTNLDSTPTDNRIVNQIKGKTGSMKERINLFYVDKEHVHLVNTIIDCFKPAFSDNVLIVTNGKHHHAVNFKPFLNPNQVQNDPSWYNRVVDLSPETFVGVSIGNRQDFEGWRPASGT